MRLKLRTKTALVLAIVSICLTLGSVYICYTRYTNTMLNKYKNNASDLAATEALLLDEYHIDSFAKRTLEIFEEACVELGGVPDLSTMSEDEVASYYNRFDEITNDEDYKKMLSALQKMTFRNEALSLYFVAIDVERQVCVYIIDGADPSETAVCSCGEITIIEGDGYNEVVNKTYNFETIDTNYPEFGWLCTAVYALIDDDNELVGLAQVDLSLDQIAQDRIAFLIRLVIVMIAFSVILTIMAASITNTSIVHPLKELSDATTSFVADRDAGGAGKLNKINIKTGDEIEALYHSFVGMEHELTGYISDLMKITAEKEKMGVELDLAKRIQATYLPCIFPAFPDRKEFDIYATMDPAKEVGGDFYDFFLIDDDHLGLVMADVSGKGVPAALFMMISKTLIKSYAQAGITRDPSEILMHVNEQLCENNEAEMFVTVWLGIFTISTGELVSSSAGHEYPACRRAGGSFELIIDKHGLPLGGMPMAKYRNYETTLNSGDILFVYTDGVAEATDANNELFGTDRMLESLNAVEGADCVDIIKTVRSDIDGFVKEAPQFDDITMLAFRYDGNED